eukprot:168127-Pyramimonas_sp.AAC.1
MDCKGDTSSIGKTTRLEVERPVNRFPREMHCNSDNRAMLRVLEGIPLRRLRPTKVLVANPIEKKM